MCADVASRVVEVRNSSRKSSPAPSPDGASPHDDGTTMSPVSSSMTMNLNGPPVTVPSVAPPPAVA